MDNDAFTSLVRERAHVKNTKQLAREAVESEFKKRRRKGRKRTYSSGSDNDDDINDGDKRRRWQQHSATDKIGTRKNDNNDDDSDDLNVPKKQEYRDRAKERREGKNDSLNRKEIFCTVIAPTAVIQKNKIKSFGSASVKKSKVASPVVIPTLEEAKLFLKRKIENTRQREFHSGSSGLLLHSALNLISNHFSPMELPPEATLVPNQRNQLQSSTAKALQRSRLVMNPRTNHKAAWQKPNEVAEDLKFIDERNGYCGGGQRLDLKVVTDIEKAVQDERKSSSWKVTTPIAPNKKANKNESNRLVCHEQNQKAASCLASAASTTVGSDDDDDNEDIFENIGIS